MLNKCRSSHPGGGGSWVGLSNGPKVSVNFMESPKASHSNLGANRSGNLFAAGKASQD